MRLQRPVVRGTILRYFHSKKELYDEILFGRANATGAALAETTEMDAETMKQEIREVTRLLLQVEIPGGEEGGK